MSELADMNTEILQCRVYRHRWLNPTLHWVENLFGQKTIARVFTCDRCHSQRFDLLRPDGGLFRRRYQYVDGYRFKNQAPLQTEIANDLLNRSRGRIKKTAPNNLKLWIEHVQLLQHEDETT